MKQEVVGTSPVRSNLCTPQLALSPAVRNKVTKIETQSGQPAVELPEAKDHPPHYESSELECCVKVEVVVLGSPSLTVLTVSVDVKQHWS